MPPSTPVFPWGGLGAEEEQEPALGPRGAGSAGVCEEGCGDVGPAVWTQVEPARLRADAALVSTAGSRGLPPGPVGSCQQQRSLKGKDLGVWEGSMTERAGTRPEVLRRRCSVPILVPEGSCDDLSSLSFPPLPQSARLAHSGEFVLLYPYSLSLPSSGLSLGKRRK